MKKTEKIVFSRIVAPAGSGWYAVAIVAVSFAMLALPRLASAVTINMTFKSGSSEFPDYDTDGAKLTALMNSVSSYYEDIFEASGTLNVEFYYSNFSDSTLALHTNLDTDGLLGRPTKCRIQVDTVRSWFFDETPFDNSEFNMVQTLCGSLTADQKSDYFNGSVPDLLEYSYKGSAVSGSAAAGKYDLWSIMLHEMGHGLGMTGACAWGEVWIDDDYDFYSSSVWGKTMAAECYSEDDQYHLEANTNMYPYSSSGKRTLPSATDLFAIASAAEWGGNLDLMRKEFYSSATDADLNNDSYWSGNWGPDSTEDAWIRDGGTAKLTANLTMNELFIGGGTTVRTGTYDLHADQNLVLGDANGDGYVEVEDSGRLLVDKKITVTNGSALRLGYNSEVQVSKLEIQTGGELSGRGMLLVDDELTVNGKITTSGGGYLSIYSDVSVNLDGGGNGELYVTDGSFSCSKALTDAHDGYIKLGSGYTITFSEGWDLGSGGVLDLDGSTANTGLHGGLFRIFGTVNATKDTEFYCDTTFESTSTINLPNSAEDLYIYGDLYIENGATLTGAGRVYGQTSSSITLDNGATIDVRFRAHGDLTVEENGIGHAICNTAFALSDDSELFMEASGNGVCDTLDSNVSMTYLRGTLHFDFINGYMPEPGDSFTIITYDIRNGTFATIDYDGGFDLVANYTSTGLTLTVEYIPGDANGDGVVDGSDATILAGYWQHGIGMTNPNATWFMGDFNGDKIVDGSDATILAGHWQATSSHPLSVPEPSVLIGLLALLLAGWASLRRRSAK